MCTEYFMGNGERVTPLCDPSVFLDGDTCSIDKIIINKKTETDYTYHKEFTEIYLWVKGRMSVLLDGSFQELSYNSRLLIIPKYQKHRLVVENEVEFYTVCIPKYSINDENISS